MKYESREAFIARLNKDLDINHRQAIARNQIERSIQAVMQTPLERKIENERNKK